MGCLKLLNSKIGDLSKRFPFWPSESLSGRGFARGAVGKDLS